MKNIHKKQKAFTLIELVVVFAIFMLVLDISLSIFVSLISRQKSILSEQELLSQTSYALEHISTALRDATIDNNGSCLGEGKEGIYALTHQNTENNTYQGIRFFSPKLGCQEFFLNSDGSLQEMKQQTAEPLLSRKFIITKMAFVINGNSNSNFASKKDLVRPRVTIVLHIGFQIGNQVQEKIFQTTVSQRDFLLP